MSETTPPDMNQPTPEKQARPGIAKGRHVILEGDDLLKELRQGWTGLPNKTLFSLAIGGLRVRMMRSTVTMLSIVLAIAFLTYTGLSSTINYRLVVVAEELGDLASSNAEQSAKVKEASERLAAMDMLGNLDVNALKNEARLAGFGEIGKERVLLPNAIRDYQRIEDAAKDTNNKFETLSKDSKTVPADLNMARSQVQIANRELDAAKRDVDKLQSTVNMARWIEANELPPNTTEQAMVERARELLGSTYRDLVLNISTPGKLDNHNLKLLDRPLSLVSSGDSQVDADTLRNAAGRVRAARQSESLLNLLRRSGVNIEKTRAGNPMDLWLIVMALMTCAVGIANAMLMSVTERFREIGTMKCLGAQDNLVVKLFLLESAFLGVVGAAGGIVIGLLVSLLAAVLQFGSFGLGYFPVVGALPTIFWSVLGGVILSVVGAVYPAYAASRMKPVDALRVDE